MHLFSKTLPLALLAVIVPIVPVVGLLGQESGGTVFRADTRLVVLHASVVDKGGHLITSLPKDAFKVFEGKVEQPIKKVTREDVPVSLGVVIDNSGSPAERRTPPRAPAYRPHPPRSPLPPVPARSASWPNGLSTYASPSVRRAPVDSDHRTPCPPLANSRLSAVSQRQRR